VCVCACVFFLLGTGRNLKCSLVSASSGYAKVSPCHLQHFICSDGDSLNQCFSNHSPRRFSRWFAAVSEKKHVTNCISHLTYQKHTCMCLC
jgi:hypothetical protein